MTAIKHIMVAGTLCCSSVSQAELPPPVANHIKYDSFHRVIGAEGKREVQCPTQSRRTAVLLITGQSNAANYATRPYQSQFGKRVVNYFNGRCFIASSPLLGSDGPWGEYWTGLANRLVAAGAFRNVVLISSAIGGTSINSWRADQKRHDGQDLNAMLMDVITSTQHHYRITDVLWHQGEADTEMPVEDYRRAFLSLVRSLRFQGVEAPVFVSVTSAGGGNPPVAQAQKSLPDPALGIFAGVNTDELVQPEERNVTGHFGPIAEEKVIRAWMDVLTSHTSRRPH